jgi:hypothetical protein
VRVVRLMVDCAEQHRPHSHVASLWRLPPGVVATPRPDVSELERSLTAPEAHPCRSTPTALTSHHGRSDGPQDALFSRPSPCRGRTPFALPGRLPGFRGDGLTSGPLPQRAGATEEIIDAHVRAPVTLFQVFRTWI